MIDKNTLKHHLKLVKELEERGSIFMGGVTVFLMIFVFFLTVTSTKALINPTLLLQRFSQPSQESNTIPTQGKSVDNGQSDTSVRTHIVQKGEGLWQVAEKHYGDGNKYLSIYEANKDRMRSPEDIREGMELVIPN